MLHPAGIAVIDAPTRAGSVGERVMFNMQHCANRAYPVNAPYEKIGEHACYANAGDPPEVPDGAIIAAPREAVEEIGLDCAGVGGAIIFASGYSETGK